MEKYNFCEVDLFIQTLYVTWLKEKRKVIDINDLSTYHELINKIAKENGIELSYYKNEDDTRTVADYFCATENKYIVFPWYTFGDVELETPDIVIENKDRILDEFPKKDELVKKEYVILYESLRERITDGINSIDDIVRKKR